MTTVDFLSGRGGGGGWGVSTFATVDQQSIENLITTDRIIFFFYLFDWLCDDVIVIVNCDFTYL